MELQNATPWPAKLFRSPLDDTRFAAALVVRVTFQLTADGPVPAAEQPWIVSPGPWAGPQGPMDGDAVFRRGGVDLFLFGTARAPGRAVSELPVELTVGAFRRRIRVIGDRAWVRRAGGLEPTAPVPFRSMPLSLDRAFGGAVMWDGLEVSYPDNPAGRGYAIDERSAEGTRLPNLEDLRSPIRRWDDRPDPVGLGCCPITSGPRLRNALVLDGAGQLAELRPTFFNAAFPGMIARRVVPGDAVRVTGVGPGGGTLAFAVPDARLLVQLRFGEQAIERPLAVDQLGIEADQQRIFVTYRYPFRYVMHPRQLRTCRLVGAA